MFLLIGFVLLLVVVLYAKKIAIFVVSWILARLLKCSSVKYGRIGIFSVTDVKLRFNSFIVVEVDKVWLSSCFFNQEFTKPLVLCFGDVRLEVSKITCGQRSSSDVDVVRELNQTSQRSVSIKQRLKRFSAILQYVSATVNTLNVVLLDVVLPDCLMHLSVEEITLDTFRDRESIQCDLLWKLLTCKMLQRSSSAAVDGSSTDLLQISAGAEFTLHFDPISYQIKLCSFKTVNPVVSLSDGFFKVVERAKHSRISRTSSGDNSNKSFDLSMLTPSRMNIEAANLTFGLNNAVNSSKRIGFNVKSFLVDLNSADDCLSTISVSELNCADGETLSFSCISFQFSLKRHKLETFIECYITTINGSANFDAYSAWNDSLTNIMYSFRTDDRHVLSSERKSNVFDPALLNVEFELSSLNLIVGAPDDKQVALSVEFISFNSLASKSFEFGVEALSLSYTNIGDSVFAYDDGSKIHYFGHILQLGACLFKYEKDVEPRKLCSQVERVRLELDLQFFNSLVLGICRVLDSFKRPSEDISSIPPSSSTPICIQANVADVFIFIPCRRSVCVVVAADDWRIVSTNDTYTLNFAQLKMGRREIESKTQFVVKLERDKCLDFSHTEKLLIFFKKPTKELTLFSETALTCIWTPLLHMIFLETKKEVTRIFGQLFKRKSPESKDQSNSQPLQLKCYANAKFSFTFKLQQGHDVEFIFSTFKLLKTQTKRCAETKQLTVKFNGHSIFVVDTFLIRRLESIPKMDEFRRAFVELQTTENPIWYAKIDKLTTIFPYEYDFAETYEEALNVFKWLKLVHDRKKQPFTSESPLPCDLLIQIQNAYFEMCDDPFEVKLRDNYELSMDEHFECERRQQMMEQKIEELRKAQPLLPRTKVDELYASLRKRNSDIYIQRSKQLCGGKPSRTSLFSWKLADVEIKALADASLHGEGNVVKNMRSMNPESVWPSSVEFNTLWCRHVGFDFKEWLMEMRDFPQPYWLMNNGHFWGRLAGAEVEGNDRAKRSVVVDVGSPFGEYVVYRNMPPLKFYYDLCSTIKSSKCTYGPCWEPCLAMINQCYDKIIKPSPDPSAPLPFWDKMRLLFHGQLSMVIEQYVVAMLASSDPYNTTEQMEWTWRNFEFDWTNGVILVMSDLDTYVRTASKYDDCCLLHLPGLKLHIKMKWACLGDPNDHHSVMPCAPDKLPDYSVHKEHDSYRAFRSQHLNLSLTLDIKNKGAVSDSKRPSVLLYANTFRWLDGMKNTISAVNRPVKRGKLFDTTRLKKPQLSRHYKDIQISVSLPKFIISYWASFSSDRGVRVIGHTMQLSSSHRMGVATKKRQTDELARREQSSFRMMYMNAELIDAEVYLYKHNPSNAQETMDSPQSFFMSLNKLSYCREATNESSNSTFSTAPRHKLVAYDLKAAWTSSNRDVVLFILDGIQKARILRRNLSSDALKTIPVHEESSEKVKQPRKSYPGGQNATDAVPSPSGKLEGGHAASLLQQLIAEADTKFMAYSEETSEIPSQQLQGILLSQLDDVLFTKWQIELINAQVLLKGCETGGYVLCTASKAQVTQRFHLPVWRENQLLAKVFWVAMLSGMQNYATVGGKDKDNGGGWADKVKWLSKELIEERNLSDQSLDVVDSLMSQGQAAGGVVIENAPCDTSQQLQRIVSRCSCQLYFCQFTDSVDLDELGDVRPLPDDEEAEFLQKKEYVDCFTLKHNMLNICTNHLQYAMILDIVNNLILYVDPKKKETEEKLLRYRLQLKLQSVDDLRPNILHLQNDVRQLLLNQRYLERQMYLVNKQLNENPADKESLSTHAELEEEMERCKQDLSVKSDDLAMTLSCFREKHIQRLRQAQLRVVDENQIPIARRFEVCFEDAQWRLTGIDGQLGLADLHIRNFVYTKLSRINDSGEHLMELGYIKITNLLPNMLYKDVLHMQHRNGVANERIPAARVVCRELAPVGGISLKEHLEVNVVPMVVQLNYVFFRTMMNYFFPDRNIDTEDQQNLDTVDEKTDSEKSITSEKGAKASVSSQGKNVSKSANAKIGKKRGKFVSEISDDIDEMKKRAQKNNMFVYIKIPEVPFIVSYKGEKDKNIEDVENFQMEFPLVEYHNRNWTWLDLALAVKQRCKRVLLQQFMKQTLLKSRLGAAFGQSLQQKPSHTNLPEEEKARLLLGTKLAGAPERAKQPSSPFFSSKNAKI